MTLYVCNMFCHGCCAKEPQRERGQISTQDIEAVGLDVPQEFILVLAIITFVSDSAAAGALDAEIHHTFQLVGPALVPRCHTHLSARLMKQHILSPMLRRMRPLPVMSCALAGRGVILIFRCVA